MAYLSIFFQWSFLPIIMTIKNSFYFRDDLMIFDHTAILVVAHAYWLFWTIWSIFCFASIFFGHHFYSQCNPNSFLILIPQTINSARMMTNNHKTFCILLTVGLMLIISIQLSYSCNEQVCASMVSKCMLTQSCKCDLKNCSCCKECFNCLSYLYSECCSCVGECQAIDLFFLPENLDDFLIINFNFF